MNELSPQCVFEITKVLGAAVVGFILGLLKRKRTS